MTKNELFLKTMFCCMTCDGDIAEEEKRLLKEKVEEHPEYFKEMPVDDYLHKWIDSINAEGFVFLNGYLSEIDSCNLSKEDELTLAGLALEMIAADDIIQFSEVKFFKKIRKHLQKVTDDDILEKFPEDFPGEPPNGAPKEDFFAPDFYTGEEEKWNVTFDYVSLNLKIDESIGEEKNE